VPDEPAVAVLAVRLEDAHGTILQRNFTTFVVEGAPSDTVTLANGRHARVARVPAASVDDARWTLKQWAVLGGLKMDGAGSGFFEYRIPWPNGLNPDSVAVATFIVEASAKRLNGKDRDSASVANQDYMRGGGFHVPSAVTIRINGVLAGRRRLDDDPADSRGILSWHAQPHDGHLYEAGSYGELLRVPVPPEVLAGAARAGEIVVRLEVADTLPGGLAIYGAHFGRYPIDPTIIFELR
jgi:hypothetical protein